MHQKTGSRFRTVSLLTVVAVYFLILVGGIVRSTGAGMGCPDWPKCFGRWVPPTHVSQLPDNYQEIYAHRGYASTEFNPVKTWIEYGNRLVGVTIGLLIFLTLLASLPYLKKDKAIFYLSLVTFLLVMFQGWLGALVVASNLKPVMISVHMVVALVIAGLLLYAMARSRKDEWAKEQFSASGAVYGFIWLNLLLTLIQVVMGIQVREGIDEAAMALGRDARESWIDSVGMAFLIHRSFSILVLIMNAVLIARLVKLPDPVLNKLGYGLGAVVLASVITGIVLAYFAIPAVLQPVHLLLSSVMFGLQFLILIKYRYATAGNRLTLAAV